jgi:hypothetical protein
MDTCTCFGNYRLFRKKVTTKQDLLLNALGYLTGGTQKRSIGIAIIEGMWDSSKKFRSSLVPALTNQAVYLLLESGQGEARHEFHNWIRIMKLILRSAPKSEFHDLYCELAEALSRRAEGDDSKGISIPNVTAARWHDEVLEFAKLK